MEKQLEKIAERMGLQVLEKQLTEKDANYMANKLRTTNKVIFELVTPFSTRINITLNNRTVQIFDVVCRFCYFADRQTQSHAQLFEKINELRNVRAAYIQNLNDELPNENKVFSATEEAVQLPYDANLFGVETKFTISEIQKFDCICLTTSDCS